MRNWLIVYAQSGGTVPPHIVDRMRPGAERVASALCAARETLAGVLAPTTRLGPYAIVGDVRLDNRDDVRRALKAPPNSSDDELVLLAFERWGEACLNHLIGVWAFGIWDADHRRLWLARDPIGIRQFYYAWRGNVLACASTLKALFPLWPAGRPPVNVPWVRRFAEWKRDQVIEETAWDGIRCLPPGHAWQLGDTDTQPQRYWYFAGQELRYRRDEEYAEHLRDLLDDAVRCRLDRKTPTAVAVSGGIDSTVVLATADAAIRSGFPAQLRLYHLAYTGDDRADESRYARDVSRYYGYPMTEINGNATLDFRTLGMCQGSPREQPYFHLGTSAWESLLRRAAADGCDTVLSGDGGDEVMGDYVYRAGRFLRDWPVWHWPLELRAAVADTGRPHWWLLAAALASDGVLRGLGRSRVELSSRAENDITWAGRKVVKILESGKMCYMLTQHIESATRAGLEIRYPFLDVRLVNFMISLPAGQHGRRGVKRWLLRQAAMDRIPESIRMRLCGATPSHLFARRAVGTDAHICEDFLNTPGLAEFVAVDAVLEAWRSLPDMLDPTDLFCSRVKPALCIAAWMRRTHAAAAIPAATTRPTALVADGRLIIESHT